MSRPDTHRQLAEGKTKIIRQGLGSPHHVLIESKDTITAGDGARHSILPGKGALANRTTCNCFNLLARAGVASHYLGPGGEQAFCARRVEMIPIELVARRVATGSYLKRNKSAVEGARFPELIIEHFLKDDARHDPLITYDWQQHYRTLHDPAHPLGTAILSREPIKSPAKLSYEVAILNAHLSFVFSILEQAWAAQNVTLVDLKIECGHDSETGSIIVSDVIDNDSWRIWPGGSKEKMLDKQVYRDLKEVTDEALRAILANYATVAFATDSFFSLPL